MCNAAALYLILNSYLFLNLPNRNSSPSALLAQLTLVLLLSLILRASTSAISVLTFCNFLRQLGNPIPAVHLSCLLINIHGYHFKILSSALREVNRVTICAPKVLAFKSLLSFCVLQTRHHRIQIFSKNGS